jgi:hypothetical protein
VIVSLLLIAPCNLTGFTPLVAGQVSQPQIFGHFRIILLLIQIVLYLKSNSPAV